MKGIRDERRNFALKELSFLPFPTLIFCREMYVTGLVMKKLNGDVGVKLLFLLRQQRYLYHQLKILTDRGCQLAGANSPELLLEVITGRRKLIEKLRELDGKLRPIKANWQKLSDQIGPEHKVQAEEMANQVREIIGQILAVSPSETVQNLPLNEDCRFDGLFAEAQSGFPPQ